MFILPSEMGPLSSIVSSQRTSLNYKEICHNDVIAFKNEYFVRKLYWENLNQKKKKKGINKINDRVD